MLFCDNEVKTLPKNESLLQIFNTVIRRLALILLI